MKRCPQCGKQYSTKANFCPVDAGRLEDVPDDAAADPNDEILGGRFAIGEHVGDGGKTGQVFEGIDNETGERCVIKWVDRDVFSSPLQMQRTEREFKQLERVTAPGIARILGHGRKGERMWVATERFEGTSLRDVVAESGALEPKRAAAVVHAIGTALSEAAKLGVIHRDVAPKNVLLGEGDAIKVINFGVAVPTTPSVRGVPEYVAPEQVDGKPVDQRSNIYSLGAVYFFLVTGRPPFEGDVQAVHSAHLHTPPAKASEHADVPDAVDKLIDRALAKQSSKRYMTLRQLLGELAKISGVEPTATQRLAALATGKKKRPNNSAAATMLGVGALSAEGSEKRTGLAGLAPPIEGRTARDTSNPSEVDEEAETAKIAVIDSEDAPAASGEIGGEPSDDDRPEAVSGVIGGGSDATGDEDSTGDEDLTGDEDSTGDDGESAEGDESDESDDGAGRSSAAKKKKRRRRRKRRKTRRPASASDGERADSDDGTDFDDDDDDDGDRDEADGPDDSDDSDDDGGDSDESNEGALPESLRAARGGRRDEPVHEKELVAEMTGGNKRLLIAGGIVAVIAVIAVIALVVS